MKADPQFHKLNGLIFVCCTLIIASCTTVPETGRRRMVMLIPESQEISLGEAAYEEVLATEPLSANKQYVEMVNRVGQRIAAVAGKPEYDWEFNVIASEQQNAFALPGGKVAIYEGILPVCQTEAGLAVVMSHEVAHALARHGGERMSQNVVVQAGDTILQIITRKTNSEKRERILGAYGVGSKYGVLLPYSRSHESEADAMGLMLLAKAGYDPEEAPRFWNRFAALKQGSQPPEFLSTHPSDERRAADLQALLPKAVEHYAQAPVRHGLGEVIPTVSLASGIKPNRPDQPEIKASFSEER